MVFRKKLKLWLGINATVSPNVLDILKRENSEILQEVEVTALDGTKQIMTVLLLKLVWRLRSPHEFLPQKTREEAEEHPLHKSLSTGGTVVTEQGDFIAVQKRSSISINSLVYRLAVGMTGSVGAATSYIGDLAVAAWERDLARAVKLYNLIFQAQSGYVIDEVVPKELKASASVGQTVESEVLRSACIWLGIDPNAPLRRQRGRPRSRKSDEDGKLPLLVKLLNLHCNQTAALQGN